MLNETFSVIFKHCDKCLFLGMMGALFFGVGKGSGSLFGGLLMSYLGAPNTFRFFAVNAAVCALVYGFFQCLYVRPRKSQKKKEASGHNEEANPEASSTGKAAEAMMEVGGRAKPVATSTPKASFQTESLAHSQFIAKGSSTKDISTEEGVISTGPRSITGGTRV